MATKAFPYKENVKRTVGNEYITTNVTEEVTHGGMDLRDYFAAKAMQALIAKRPALSESGSFGEEASRDVILKMMSDISLSAYTYADAMMEARDEK